MRLLLLAWWLLLAFVLAQPYTYIPYNDGDWQIGVRALTVFLLAFLTRLLMGFRSRPKPGEIAGIVVSSALVGLGTAGLIAIFPIPKDAQKLAWDLMLAVAGGLLGERVIIGLYRTIFRTLEASQKGGGKDG